MVKFKIWRETGVIKTPGESLDFRRADSCLFKELLGKNLLGSCRGGANGLIFEESFLKPPG